MTDRDLTPGPEPIKRLIGSIFHSRNWETERELNRVFLFWEEAVGTEISELAQPHLVRKTTLWVRVRDSIWMQQLHLQKIHLLGRLNHHLKNASLTDIRFQLDPGLVSPGPVRKETSPPQPSPDPAVVEQGMQLTSSLKNSDVRDALRSLWNKLHR